MIWKRCAGVLLHPTSLVSPFGIGDLGPHARDYVDWLADAGMSWWQILPLNPEGPGHSPYSSISTYAGNPLLISPEELERDGLLEPSDLLDAPAFPDHAVDFATVIPWKQQILRKAFERFRHTAPATLEAELDEFRLRHRGWLEHYALFAALKSAHAGAPWFEWPEPLANRDPAALTAWRNAHRDEVALVELGQLLFFRQWARLHEHASGQGVRILGDVPIFVSHDSVDVWVHRELFRLDRTGRPIVVSGVPPDYFSATGQLWGNPLYDWERHAEGDYAWWVDRLRHTLELVDAVRLDHFRGFAACWEVPAEDHVATNGRWVPGPGRELFDRVAGALGDLPFVAEDLGFITDDVHRLREGLGLPGMAILQFGFSPGQPRSSYIPYAHRRDLVVYTGTHDNNTSLGWYLDEASPEVRRLVRAYTGSSGHEIHWDLLRLAFGSVADTAIVPHQDLVGLGGDCRMNRPGVAVGNWRFRLTPWMLDDKVCRKLADTAWVFGRRTEQEETEAETGTG